MGLAAAATGLDFSYCYCENENLRTWKRGLASRGISPIPWVSLSLTDVGEGRAKCRPPGRIPPWFRSLGLFFQLWSYLQAPEGPVSVPAVPRAWGPLGPNCCEGVGSPLWIGFTCTVTECVFILCLIELLLNIRLMLHPREALLP